VFYSHKEASRYRACNLESDFHFGSDFGYCYLRGACVTFVRMRRNMELDTHDRLDLLDYQMKRSHFRLRDPRNSEDQMWV
jgi:hypothetical protein